MADFEDALNSLLSNPQAMGQILSLAGQLGGQGQDGQQATPAQESPPAETAASQEEPALPLEDLAQFSKLLPLLQKRDVGTPEARALLFSLRPFLKPERQRKLDRALRLAGLSQVAREALALWKEGELHV